MLNCLDSINPISYYFLVFIIREAFIKKVRIFHLGGRGPSFLGIFPTSKNEFQNILGIMQKCRKWLKSQCIQIVKLRSRSSSQVRSKYLDLGYTLNCQAQVQVAFFLRETKRAKLKIPVTGKLLRSLLV